MQTLIADKAGERLDAFLARNFPDYSRSSWQKMMQQDRVLVKGNPVKTSHKLAEGDMVQVTLPEVAVITPQKFPIIYEDDDVVVINKPAGVLTHSKGVVNEEFTIADFVRPLTTDSADNNRPGIVHRLDRATSGVIIAAKNAKAKSWLQKQFSNRKTKKTYLALVKGRPKQPAALLQLPIERNPKKPQTFRVASNGKSAETAYTTEAEYKDYTLLRLKPHTGRTHQLRVHALYLGTPIVGDILYGSEHKKLGRMFLHAAELELTLPSKERKVFTAPLPKDLQDYLDSLQ